LAADLLRPSFEFRGRGAQNIQSLKQAGEIRRPARFARLTETFQGALEGWRAAVWDGVRWHQSSFSTGPEARAWETNAWLSWTEST
jgi:hypothetical protein